MNNAIQNLKYRIEDWGYSVRNFCRAVRLRPLVICPFCRGKGGEMSGYYEPEWSECSTCWRCWRDLEDCGWNWFVGRVPVWTWVQSKLSIRAGLWYPLPVTGLIKCKVFGLHRWMNEDESQPGLRICANCWKNKTVDVGPHEFVWLPGGGMGWKPVGHGLRVVKDSEIYTDKRA